MSTASIDRPQTVESVTVLQVGKFGIRVDEKNWYGVNDPVTPQQFEAGEGYRVAVVTSKTGKKYISEILGQEEKHVASAPPQASVSPSNPKPLTSTPVTPSKLDEKSIQIQRQGLYQAALQSPVLSQFVTGNNVTEYLNLVRAAAEAGIAFVAERP
jgi:hypothetical protein